MIITKETQVEKEEHKQQHRTNAHISISDGRYLSRSSKQIVQECGIITDCTHPRAICQGRRRILYQDVTKNFERLQPKHFEKTNSIIRSI